MARPRLIPVLLLKHGVLVRSQAFRTDQVIGNPMSTVKRLSDWNVDELILLDISSDDFHDLRRDDIQQRYQGTSAIDVLREVSKVCFMPLAFGGKIGSLDDIHQRLAAGADKVVINTAAVDDPKFIKAASNRFGRNALWFPSMRSGIRTAGSKSIRRSVSARPDLILSPGRAKPLTWEQGVFSLFIDRDGAATGYDLDLVARVANAVEISVIACGGVGSYEDLAEGITKGDASAVAAANIFHFFEHSYPRAKKNLHRCRTCNAACSARQPMAAARADL